MIEEDIAALKLDAERYRWLRQWAGDKMDEMPELVDDPIPQTPEEFDAALDKLIAAHKLSKEEST